MSKKAIFWDFDGTLVYPNEAYTLTLGEALRESGYETDIGDLRRCVVEAIPWHHSGTIYPHAKDGGFWREVFGVLEKYYEAFRVRKEDRDRISRRYAALLPKFGYTAYDDAEYALGGCSRLGFECFLLSNNFPELKQAVKALGLGGYFSDYIISGSTGYDKPCREIFDIALRKAGYPDITYMVGDNPYADIGGAKAAGMKTIWIDRSGKGDLNGADHICRSLSEIPEILAGEKI